MSWKCHGLEPAGCNPSCRSAATPKFVPKIENRTCFTCKCKHLSVWCRFQSIPVDFSWFRLVLADFSCPQLVPAGFSWFQLILVGSSWDQRSQSISADPSWSQPIPADFSWFQLPPADSSWFQLISVDFSWCQLISVGFSWNQRFQSISADFSWSQSIPADFSWLQESVPSTTQRWWILDEKTTREHSQNAFLLVFLTKNSRLWQCKIISLPTPDFRVRNHEISRSKKSGRMMASDIKSSGKCGERSFNW